MDHSSQGLPLLSSSALVVEITHFSPVGPVSGCGCLNLEGVLLAFRGKGSLRINSGFSVLLGFPTTISTRLPKLGAQRVFAGSQLCLGWGRAGFVPEIRCSLICSLPLDYSRLTVFVDFRTFLILWSHREGVRLLHSPC